MGLYVSLSVLGKPTGAISDIVSYVITYEISYVITSEMSLQRLLHYLRNATSEMISYEIS